MSEQVIVVGKWLETASRDVSQCPSYYAADYEVLRTVPGEYDLSVVFVGGYLVPMPYWVVVGIPAERIEGRTYNGFGGLNFSSNELPRESKALRVQTYVYNIKRLVADGKVRLDAGREWLTAERPWSEADAPKTWQEVR